MITLKPYRHIYKFMNYTKVEITKAPLDESFKEIIAEEYPLQKELSKLSPMEFLIWLEQEVV